MTERLRSGNNFVNSANISAKMSNDLTPRKTMLIVVIVVGCFAVLWPKVFYPMLVGSANQHIKPSPIDKTTGCCDVISELDVNTIKIMSELCRTIIKNDEDLPLTGREIVAKCQSAVLETCGIDISAVLQEQVRLGQSVKQILDEIRSLNGSLCLKYNFGVAPWRLGVPHRVTVNVPSSSIRQERPLHLRSELVHPAFRERGRAIPQPQVTSSRTITRVVEGRPGPIPGMRPTLGGAGHVVPPPKQSTSSMGLIMPIYTIGIVIFFTYTVLKIIFKKQPEALYPPVEPDPNFRREVFESERSHVAPKLTRESVSSKLVVNAMSALLDEVDQEIESRRIASEIADQDVVANGNLPQEEEQPSVKVLGMEMTASCEGGKKWSRPNSPVLPAASPHPQEPVEPPQEIFLEGALPAQSHLLVSDSATEAERNSSEEDPAVVLAGKMTLSVISLDSSENGVDEPSNMDAKQSERSSSNVSEEFEKIEPEEPLDDVQQSDNIQLLEQIQNEIKELDEKRIITDLESTVKPLDIDEIVYTSEISPAVAKIETEFIEKENNLDDLNTSTKSEFDESALIESTNNQIKPSEEGSTKGSSSENNKEEIAEIETVAEDINKKFIETEISPQQDLVTPKSGKEEPVLTESTDDKTGTSKSDIEESVLTESTENKTVTSTPDIEETVLTESTDGKTVTSKPDIEETVLTESTDAKTVTSKPDIEETVLTESTDDKTVTSKSDIEETVLTESTDGKRVTSKSDTEESVLTDSTDNKTVTSKSGIEETVLTESTDDKAGSVQQIKEDTTSDINNEDQRPEIRTAAEEDINKRRTETEVSVLGYNEDGKLYEITKEIVADGKKKDSTEAEIIEPGKNTEEETNLLDAKNQEKSITPSSEPISNVNTELQAPELNTNEEVSQEEITEGTNAELLPSSNISESLVSSTISETPISSNVSESISSSNVSELLESNDVSLLSNASDAENNLQGHQKVDSINEVNKKSEQDTKTDVPVSTIEKETFEKLNEAIAELSSEFRSRDKEKEEPEILQEEEELSDEEEVEYEYEYSDNEGIEDEIHSVNRLDNEDTGASRRVNGENQEISKYGTTSSITLAENDISDDEVLEDEDDDVQEIIEYISDDEEEIEDIVEPVRTNNTNHIPEQPGPQ